MVGNFINVSYSNYLGLTKPVISFFNYECNTNYFPLVWRDPAKMKMINDLLSGFQHLSYCKRALKNRPVYYFVQGDLPAMTDLTAIRLKENLQKECNLINTSNFASLYKLK